MLVSIWTTVYQMYYAQYTQIHPSLAYYNRHVTLNIEYPETGALEHQPRRAKYKNTIQAQIF